MDLDSLGSCDSGPTVSNGFDSVESLLAYTVDKRQRNAEAASPELRKEALLSNTVKRAHRLLVPNETYYAADFDEDDHVQPEHQIEQQQQQQHQVHHYEESDHIDVMNEKQQKEDDENEDDHEINQNNKRKRDNDSESIKPPKKFRATVADSNGGGGEIEEEQMNNLSLSTD